jgi:hypothetical protein
LSGLSFERSTPRLLEPDTEENLRALFEKNHWTDYLSIVLPTEEHLRPALPEHGCLFLDSALLKVYADLRKPDEVSLQVSKRVRPCSEIDHDSVWEPGYAERNRSRSPNST